MFEYFTYNWLLNIANVMCSSILISALINFILVKFSNKIKFGIDKPNERKVHKDSVLRIGGLGIFLSIILSLYYFNTTVKSIHSLYLTSSIVFIIGFIDDLFSIKAIYKLCALILCSLFLSLYCNVYIHFFNFEPVDILITLFWVVGITSAFNAIDHIDGLCAGTAGIAVFTFLVIAIQTNQQEWSILSASIFGALVGFLIFNFPKAKIFMGDSGSFILGFLISELSIVGAWSTNVLKASLIPVIILLVPIIDLIFVIFKRRYNKETKNLFETINYSAKDHIGHILLEMGLTVRKSVLFIYFISITLSLSAIVIRNMKPFEAILMLIISLNIVLIIIISIRHLKIKK